MSIRTNLSRFGNFELADLANWANYDSAKLAAHTSYLDKTGFHGGTQSLRIDSNTETDAGRVGFETLQPGTYTASIWAETLNNVANAAFIIKGANDSVLVERHVLEPNKPFQRLSGTFTLTAPTTIGIVLGMGSYGVRSRGSIRFDDFMIEAATTAGFGFDGNTPDTAGKRYDWTGTPNASASTETTETTASFLSWKLANSDDFSSAGSVPDPAKWYCKDGFKGTDGAGDRIATRTYQQNGKAYISAVGDETGGMDSLYRPNGGLVYGRWVVYLNVTVNTTYPKGYIPAVFLWPDSEIWEDGENDGFEGATNGEFYDPTVGYATMHKPGAPRDIIQNHIATNFSQPVKLEMIWLPDRMETYYNDVLVLQTTDKTRIPTKPMHLVFQVDVGVPKPTATAPYDATDSINGVPVRNGYPAPLATPFAIEVDKVEIYTPSTDPATTPSTGVGSGAGGTGSDATPGTSSALTELCASVYEGVKHRNLRSDGAVLQNELDNKVPSEAIAYMAMAAVQMNDRATFDLVESFALNVMERRNWKPGGADSWREGTDNDPRLLAPNLMGWDYRINAFGGNPANTMFDWNFAFDADIDRSRNLIYAYMRWGELKYLNRGLNIALQLKRFGHNVWDRAQPGVTPTGYAYPITDEYGQSGPIDARGGRVAGHHLFQGFAEMEQNLSYFDPTTNHLIADLGRDVFWTDLALKGGYDSLKKATDNLAGMPTPTGLPPDWDTFSFADGQAYPLTAGERGWNYTRATVRKYDAFRVDYRLVWAYDYYKDPEILQILAPLKAFYTAQWQANAKIAAEYDHAGNPLSGGYESTIFTGGAEMVLTCGDPNNAIAAEIRAAKLDVNTLYGLDRDGFGYLATFPGGNTQQNGSYFGDFWGLFYFMRKAGLWKNFGQTQGAPGDVLLSSSETIPTVSDYGNLSVKLSLSSAEVPSTTVADSGNLTVERRLSSNEAIGTVQDYGNLSVVGEVITVPSTPTNPTVPTLPVGVAQRDRWFVVSLTKNEQLELTGIVDNLAMLRGGSGLTGGPPVRIRRETIYGLPGAVTRDIQHDVKTVQMPLMGFGIDMAAVMELVRKVTTLMDPVTNEVLIRYVGLDGRVSELKCQCTGGLELQRIGSSGPSAQEYALEFQAEDPYWYGQTIDVAFKAGAADADWFGPGLFPPLTLSSSAVVGDVLIDTKSDVPVEPIWKIFGPGSNPSATRLGVGEGADRKWSIQKDMRAGYVITVDTRSRGLTAKTVFDSDGVSLFGDMPNQVLWSLLPGRNRVQLTLANGLADVSYIALSYRDATLNP